MNSNFTDYAAFLDGLKQARKTGLHVDNEKGQKLLQLIANSPIFTQKVRPSLDHTLHFRSLVLHSTRSLTQEDKIEVDEVDHLCAAVGGVEPVREPTDAPASTHNNGVR